MVDDIERIKRREVKTAFALSGNGALVNIRDASRDQSYSCPGCSESVIPVMGDNTAWHYRHMTNVCSYETYLHRTAKIAFYERAATSVVLPLVLEREVICSSEKRIRLLPEKSPCKNTVAARYNLLNLFDDIALEARDNDTGLTPDVFLRNRKSGAKCYIEIYVTHACSEEKILSGIPIIEISVSSEDDIDWIRSESIDSRKGNVTVYSFNPEIRATDVCTGRCQYADVIFRSWEINTRGRLHANEISFRDIETSMLETNQIWPADISSEIEMARLRQFLKSQSITDYNCLLCKSSSSWNDGVIWCSVKKRSVPYDAANQCAFLEIDE